MNPPSTGVGASSPAASLPDLSSAFGQLGTELVSRLKAALGIGQATRLLQIETALPSATLVVERCHITEAVHADEPLWADIDCLSTSAYLELKALTGEQVTLRLMQSDGSWRNWHGYVVRCAQLGADGGLARYRLTLAAWTHWLRQRRDTRIFQDQTAADVISAVMQAYPQAHFKLDVAQPGPVRAITTQYRETDWAFVQRLMAAEGWSWRLAHDGAAEGAITGARAAKHTLVIFDQHAEQADLGALRYSRPDVRGGKGLVSDTVTAWSVGQRVTPNAVTLAAWDERQLAGVSAQALAIGQHGKVPTLEAYFGQGERRHADGRVTTAQPASSAVAEARAQALMAAHELHHRHASGQSAVRALREGVRFQVTEHSLYDLDLLGLVQGDAPTDDGRFVVLSVTHEAANNLGSQAAQILKASDIEQGSYRNQFSAAPATVRIVPLPPQQPTAPGLQTALVVAAPGEPLTTDRDGRIRVQFTWQRGARPVAGALSAPPTPAGADTGHAPGDATSGTWVRVAQGVAGPNWGAVFTPRAGTEVLVDFVDGDIDRPIVVGQLHNGQHDLPWPAGLDSGANHPGTISGWHHQHLDQQGANQWLIDDATGQLRMRLASHSASTGHSELTLGHIIQQSAQGGSGHAQRGQWLGEGFYGHTEGWAVVRAGQGLLLSTSARNALGSSVTSTQMDAAEAVGQLKAARQLGDTLSQSARQQGAQGLASHDDGQALQQHADHMCPQAQGQYAGSVGGQPARKAKGRTLGEPVERFNQPLIHLDTPVSASFVTPSSISLFSGQDTSLSTQGDAHLTSAHTLSSVSGQTTSLYTHAGGIKGIAANGPLSLRAHTDAQQIWSDKDLTVQSTTDEIRIQASDSITLTAGQSQIVIKGGDITFTCPGKWTVKGAGHAWGAGGSQAAQLAALPDQRFAALGEAKGTFRSTFARDQLKAFASEAEEAAFVSDMAITFGTDVPLSAYQLFYRKAKAGLPDVPHQLAYGGGAEYDADARCIWVDQSLAVKAARNDETAQWDLLLALVGAWGQYIAHQLRHVWSDVGGGPDTAYSLALLPLLDQGETVYGALQSPDASGEVKVMHQTPQRAIQRTERAYLQAVDAHGAQGVPYLHDGVYRPDRDGPVKAIPVFDAKMMKDEPRKGVHNHHSIEAALALDDRFKGDYERGLVYYGNWLRDWSQMCDTFMLPPGKKGMGLSRESITTAVMLMGQMVAASYITKKADWDKARADVEFSKSRLPRCMELLGCYRPEEHIDNPAGLPDQRPHSYPKGWMVSLPIDKRILEVDPATSVRRYIADQGLAGDHPSSLVYMQKQLKQACQLGKTPEGLIRLGFALHVLEDFFAHTNFVELALHKAKYGRVIAWVPTKANLRDMPITTGQFTDRDAAFSLMYKMADLLLPTSQTGARLNKIYYEGLELSDWVFWAVLNDSGRTTTASAYKGYCQVMYKAEAVAGGYVPEVIKSAYQDARVWVYGVLAAAIKDQASGRIRQPQIDGYDFAHSIDPTHTMVAKDANDHPLHDLAGSLAQKAVLDVGRCVADVWEGKATTEEALACASKYFKHPSYTTEFDENVRLWARDNEDAIVKAADQVSALKRAREHQHHGDGDHKPSLPKQFQASWTFWTEHYAALTGRQDVLASIPPGEVA